MGKKEIMNNRFADLTEKEAHVLCYIAFFGEAYGTLSAAFIKSIKLSSKKFEALISRLKELNYLVGTNSVSPDKHLDVLDYLAIERQQWLDGFRQIGLYHRTQQAEYLWKITELVRNREFDKAAKITQPLIGWGREQLALYPYISKRLSEDDCYIRLLDSDQLRRVCSSIIPDYFAKGNLKAKELKSILSLIDRFKVEERDKLKEQISVYSYFLDGNAPVNNNPASAWGFALNAILELYAGHVEDSLVLFRKTLKGKGRKIECVPSPLVCFFMAVCILRYIAKYGVYNGKATCD